MKLFTSPGVCALSCHIALEEAKIPFDAAIASRDEKGALVWAEVEKLNPQGLVPVLVLDNGKSLTQNVAILSYIAERAPQANLLPAVGSFERAQVYQWASWVSSDLHPSFHPLFDEETPSDKRQKAVEHVQKLLSEADKHLEARNFLVGSTMSIADCYLFVVFNWTKFLKVPTEQFRNLNAYVGRIAERPAVQAAMKREGLLGPHAVH